MTPVHFVVVAHHDDWQIFIGARIARLLSEPGVRIVVIVTTAGDAGSEPYHWQSRHAGDVFSLLAALRSFRPYESPLGCEVRWRHEYVEVNAKPLLRTVIVEDEVTRATLYAMHLPDGGTGQGFPPRHQSLAGLYEGVPAQTIWPPHPPSTYESWSAFVTTLDDIMTLENPDNGRATVYASSLDENENAGDHSDHRFTSLAVAAIAGRRPNLHVRPFVSYALRAVDKNLSDAEARVGRSMICAYGGGYTASAARLSDTWRTGWVREIEAFEARESIAPDDGATNCDQSECRP